MNKIHHKRRRAKIVYNLAVWDMHTLEYFKYCDAHYDWDDTFVRNVRYTLYKLSCAFTPCICDYSVYGGIIGRHTQQTIYCGNNSEYHGQTYIAIWIISFYVTAERVEENTCQQRCKPAGQSAEDPRRPCKLCHRKYNDQKFIILFSVLSGKEAVQKQIRYNVGVTMMRDR